MPKPSNFTDEEWRVATAKAAETRRLRKEGVIDASQTVDDISDLIPKARTHAEIWAAFHGSAASNAAASRRKPGAD